MLARKKDGGSCFCVIYRQPSLVTAKDLYPLLWMDDTLETLAAMALNARPV